MSRQIIAAVDDMFFASKIRATAEHLGAQVQFARSVESVIEASHESAPALIIVDLHSQKCDPFALAVKLKSDEETRAIPLIGFFSHVQTALMQQAQTAGYDRVMPRSAFTKQLPDILQLNLIGD